MGLLKFLFITICVLWLLRVIARLLLPLFFQKLMTKVQNQANQQFRQQQYHTNHTPDGKIRVDYVPPKEKSQSDHVGDFVEYEEIKSP